MTTPDATDADLVCAYLAGNHGFVLTYSQAFGDAGRDDPATPLRQLVWRWAVQRTRDAIKLEAATARLGELDSFIGDLIAAEQETSVRVRRLSRPARGEVA